MEKERIYIFDTTLRDGAQTNGLDFSLEEKIAVAKLLDQTGIDFVEGGYPGANPTDSEFFRKKRTEHACFTAFGMTKRAGRSVSNDPGLQDLISSESDAICFVAKSWDYHVKVALEISNEENLECIAESVKAAKKSDKLCLLDCEHFFDGYKANPEYALACAKKAYDAGARWVVLCDTNGGTLPFEVESIVTEVAKVIPGENLGIHAHDDTGHAVANSLTAVNAGVRQIQGTLNGIGERCGNANLITLIPTIMLKDEFSNRFELGISQDQLSQISHVSRKFDELINRSPNRHAPYVGLSAFSTKAGIHASAIMKDPNTYEHVNPYLVGNRRRILVSDQAGKSNLIGELKRLGIDVDGSEPKLDKLLREIKERESMGYAYEAADASFFLLASGFLGDVPKFFEIEGFKVTAERRYNALGNMVTVSEAVVKLQVDGEICMSVAEGNGPVNALDNALRKDLGRYQNVIEDLVLVDFKVRILNGGTEAITRVLIESMSTLSKERWFTIGVSPNIIDASFQALIDSINYKLLKDKEKLSLELH